jgi:hypothetical protein
MRTILAAAALAIALHATTAAAQTTQDADQRDADRERRFRELDGFRRRPTDAQASSVHAYQGMYFRPDVGLGYMSVSIGSQKFTGTGGSFGLHFGAALAPDVLLGVHLYESFMANPTAGGSAAGYDTSGSSVGVAGLGPELTVGLPADFYWAATIALTRVATSTGDTSGATKAGVGGRFALGFDHWSRSGKWAIGAAAQASYSRNQDQGADPAMVNAWTVGAALSMSFD